MSDPAKFDAAKLREARRLVEVEFERITGRAFVQRFTRVRRTVDSDVIVLPHYEVDPTSVSISTIAADGSLTAFTGTQFVHPSSGVIELGEPLYGHVAISYVHGYHAPPTDVRGAFMTRVLDVISRPLKGQDSRATTFTAETGGTFTLAVPGMRGAVIGIPDVDVVLRDYTVREARMA